MMEISLRQRLNVMSIVKLLVVLSLPLYGYISVSYATWISLLFVVGAEPFFTLTPIPFLFVAILILLPGLIFERQLNSRPITQSIRKRAAAVCILSWFLGVFLPTPLIIPYFYIPGMSYYYVITQVVPLLAIAFYVILPLLSREVVIRSIPSDPGNLNYGTIKSIIQGKTKRERLLVGLLWAGLMFFPFMISTVIPSWNHYFDFISFFYRTRISLYSPWLYDLRGYNSSIFEITQIPIVDFSLQFEIFSGITFLFIGLLSALRFVFVRDVFRFKDGLIKRGRLVSIAVLGEILPAAIFTILMVNTYYDPLFMPVVLPIPLLPIAGFVFIRFSRLVRMKEEIWPDQKFRMWYEKEQEAYMPAQTEESITVPISYLLISQVRKRLRE